MKILILHGSPNADGLTSACAEAVAAGARSAGFEAETLVLCDHELNSCGQCGNGWGKCSAEGWCVIDDDFAAVRERVHAADALAIVTPVYFGDLSEVMKNVLDRLRRCEHGRDESPMKGMWTLVVSAAGGGGGGTLPCSESLERYCAHIGCRTFDFVTVTRRNREYKLATIEAAAAAMAREAAAD